MRVEGIVETLEEATDKDNGPPKATVARRAKSYSDFYEVVTAHLKKEKEKELERKSSRENIGNELEFAEWYSGVNDELLEASHDEYKYVLRELGSEMKFNIVVQALSGPAPSYTVSPRQAYFGYLLDPGRPLLSFRVLQNS